MWILLHVIMFACLSAALGDRNMNICRPSSLGFLSTVAISAQLGAKLRQKLLADVGVRHFTAAETHRDLDPVAVLQELQSRF